MTAKQDDGLTLLQEIRGDGLANAPPDAPTDGVGAPAGGVHAHDLTHTVSDIQSLDSGVSLIQSPNKNNGGGAQNSADTVLDFNKE